MIKKNKKKNLREILTYSNHKVDKKTPLLHFCARSISGFKALKRVELRILSNYYYSINVQDINCLAVTSLGS